MEKLFDKNRFRNSNEIVKIIIDTDPGVDDIACFIYALNDENVDIQLVTTVAGNVSLEKATRNILHVMDLFSVDIPVAVGAKKALFRESPTAEFIHGETGLGGYSPPEKTIRKPLDKTAVTAMRDVIERGNGDIIPVMLGPLTNIANLIMEYPELVKKIPKIVVMGGAPYGNKNYPEHTSFNLSTDPEAFNILLGSNIPILMCPSHMGRTKAHLDELFVHSLKDQGDVGRFLFTMYQKYWEPKYPDKRITTNDSCALFALIYPKMFDLRRVNVTVDTADSPGRTHIEFDENGRIEFIDDLDKASFLSLLLAELTEMQDIKLNF